MRFRRHKAGNEKASARGRRGAGSRLTAEHDRGGNPGLAHAARASHDRAQFRRQVPIGRYIADFACHAARLVVEIDGGQHDSASPPETARSGFLQQEGYRILRFWNNDVLANPEGVCEMIVNALAASPPPNPPPSRGRGFRQNVEER